MAIHAHPDPTGFTLAELLGCLAITAMVMLFGMPGLTELVSHSRQSGVARELVSDIQLARAAAMALGDTITLCLSAEGLRCSETASAAGWLIVAHEGTARARVLRSRRTGTNQQLRTNRPAFRFRPFPRRSTNGTLLLCSAGVQPLRVIISYTGRPRRDTAATTAC